MSYFKATLYALAIAISTALPVRSATLNYSGTTAGAPAWNRPVENLSELSNLGTKTRYSVANFIVDTNGVYAFTSNATNAWDNFLFLYQGSFDASTPLFGALIANDDNPNIGSSGFSYSLLANTSYSLVTTGYENTDLGAFSNSIVGDGNFVGSAQQVPEPAAIAGILLAGGSAIFLRRKLTKQG